MPSPRSSNLTLLPAISVGERTGIRQTSTLLPDKSAASKEQPRYYRPYLPGKTEKPVKQRASNNCQPYLSEKTENTSTEQTPPTTSHMRWRKQRNAGQMKWRQPNEQHLYRQSYLPEKTEKFVGQANLIILPAISEKNKL